MLYLCIIASLSPLLTISTLWQIKEWRIDRLKEHLRCEGYFRQLFGVVRPVIVVGALLFKQEEVGIWLLAILTVVQIVLKKQRYPVWTKKAAILVSGSLLGCCVIGLLVIGHWSLVIIPIVQPLILLFAWTAFLPIDTFMKKRIMQKAADLRARYPNITCIGITGSVGKTTTKELVAHILKDQNALCTPAYVNSEMGVAKWLLKELPKHKIDEELIVIVEMGAYRSGEIARLCDIAKPSIGVLTYIGSQHIALFGSQETLLNAKAELIESLPKDGTAFLNADNELALSVAERCRGSVVTVGTGGHATLEAFDIEESASGIAFRINDQKYTVPLQGTHNVTNVLLAIGVARHLNVSENTIKSTLRTFAPPSSTFSVRSENGITILDDTHNASPESFRAAIAWAKSQPMESKILLTPGLIEQGERQARIHHELGSYASGIFNRVIFTSAQGMDAFAEGYEGTVEMIHSKTASVSSGDLLVCVGRISSRTVDRMLP